MLIEFIKNYVQPISSEVRTAFFNKRTYLLPTHRNYFFKEVFPTALGGGRCRSNGRRRLAHGFARRDRATFFRWGSRGHRSRRRRTGSTAEGGPFLFQSVDPLEQVAEQRKARSASPGDPQASAAAVLAIVDADEPPLRVFFGTAPLGIARADYASRLATWEQWQHVAELAQG